MKEAKERQISPRSLENLKLGAAARHQGKIRRNTTLLPETIAWLEAHGNASFLIDELVAAAKRGELRFSHGSYQDEIARLRLELANAKEQIEALQTERDHKRAELEVNLISSIDTKLISSYIEPV